VAFASLLPALSPARRKSVFAEILETNSPPFSSIIIIS